MPHDGTGQSWDIAAPADTDGVPDGAKEIRDLRTGIGARIAKEHDAPDDGGLGGEHKAGSAKAWFQGTAPTVRPDGITEFTNLDRGRLWANNGVLSVYSGVTTGWIKVSVADSSQIGNSAVTEDKIQNGAVTSGKLADGAVISAKLGTSSVVSAKLADGAVTTAKIADGSVTPAKLSGGAGGTSVAILDYETSAGTPGGTPTADAWNDRALNLEKSDPSGIVSLSASAFTLVAGTYLIEAWCNTYRVGKTLLRLRNTTDSSTPFFGVNATTPNTEGSSHLINMCGIVTIGSTKTFKIQQYCELADGGTSGLGRGNNISGTVEVHTVVKITKMG